MASGKSAVHWGNASVIVKMVVEAPFPPPGSTSEEQRGLVLVIAFYYHAIAQANMILHANIWHQYDFTDP